MSEQLTYKMSGVDIDFTGNLIKNISNTVNSTHNQAVLSSIGGFAGLFELQNAYKKPVLVSSTDGVGTKLKLACKYNIHQHIGIDLVAMSVNDILVQGARPLFFLDYISFSKVSEHTLSQLVHSIATGCKQANCSLIGGETAQMPDVYSDDEYDLAGFVVGVVEKEQIIDGSKSQQGHVILGLESSGIHANGYSLVRKILHNITDINTKIAGKPLLELLMEPTKIYCAPILDLLTRYDIFAMSHITGGGIMDNIIRTIPNSLTAVIQSAQLPQLPIFDWIKYHSNLSNNEMLATFNCGIGFTITIAREDAAQIHKYLLDTFNIKSFIIGELTNRTDKAINVI